MDVVEKLLSRINLVAAIGMAKWQDGDRDGTIMRAENIQSDVTLLLAGLRDYARTQVREDKEDDYE